MEEEHYYEEYEIDLREYILLLWKNKWFIIGLFILAVVAAFLVTQYYMTPVYQTEASIELTNVGGKFSRANTAKEILKESQIIKEKINKSSDKQHDTADINNYMNNNIEINQLENTQILRLTVRNKDPELAQEIIEVMINNYNNKSGDYYQEFISSKEDHLEYIKREINDLEESINETSKQITEIRNMSLSASEKTLIISSYINKIDNLRNQKNNFVNRREKLKEELMSYYPLEVLNPPYIPQNPVSPNTRLNVAIAGVLALMLGVFIVFFREFMKDIDWEEVEEDIEA